MRGGDDEIERMLWISEERRRRERVEREGIREGAWLAGWGELVAGEEVVEAGWMGRQVVERDRDRVRERDGKTRWERDAWMAEEIARREEEELDALLEMNGSILSQSQSQEGQSIGEASDGLDGWNGNGHMREREANQTETPYGSDEEEYDDLFMEVIRNEQQDGADHDMMDIS